MKIVIGTEPVQLASPNRKRKRWELQFVPASIEAGNTGLIYIGRGYPPSTNADSPSKDHVLNSGSSVGDNVDALLPECPYKGAVFAISDTTSQVCTMFEENVEEEKL